MALTRHSGKQLSLDLLPQTKLLKWARSHDLKVMGSLRFVSETGLD